MHFVFEWMISMYSGKEILYYKESVLNASILKLLASDLPVTSNSDSHPQNLSTILLYFFFLCQLTTHAKNNKNLESIFYLQINIVYLWEMFININLFIIICF